MSKATNKNKFDIMFLKHDFKGMWRCSIGSIHRMCNKIFFFYMQFIPIYIYPQKGKCTLQSLISFLTYLFVTIKWSTFQSIFLKIFSTKKSFSSSSALVIFYFSSTWKILNFGSKSNSFPPQNILEWFKDNDWQQLNSWNRRQGENGRILFDIWNFG